MRLIDADALWKLVKNFRDTDPEKMTKRKFVCDAILLILLDEREVPTIDPESLRPKGKWYWVAYDSHPKIGNWHCSVCNRIPKSLKKEDFCPNCGADMRGDS